MTELLDRSLSLDSANWPILSYSQLSSWDRCEYAWSLGYREQWVKKQESESLNVGSMIHELLDIYYHNLSPEGGGSYESAKFGVETALRDYVEKGSQDHSLLTAINRAGYSVMRYVKEFAPVADKEHKPLASEYHFTVPFVTGKGRNFVIQGYVDLITESYSKMWCWDHKSSGNAQFWTPMEVMMDPQLPLYAICLREVGMPVHGYIINQFNTYSYKDMKSVALEKLFNRGSAHRTDKELDSVLTEIKYMVDDLLENNETPRRSLRRDCRNCQFQEPCLMDLKKIDMAPVLLQNFKKKDKVEVQLNFRPEVLI